MPLKIISQLNHRLFHTHATLWVRLLTTHALVMLIGIVAILLVGNLYHVNLPDTLVACMISLTSLVTISWLISTKISRPLQRLDMALQTFQSGDLAVRVPPCSIPEIHRLGLSFNHLAASLQGVEQRRRELTSDLAHELRTPVTVIHGYLEMLDTGRIQFNPTIGSQMSQETQRIQRLVDNVLELSKLEAGYLPLHLQTLQPVPLLNHVITLFEAECLKANCQLRSQYPPTLPAIYADPDRLIQILVNLMNNAIAYSGDRAITLRAWATHFELWIAVEDTGVGISKTDLSHIFERFWQTEHARTHKIGSAGIGLAISKRLVELQGGRIEVESEVNKGSTFRFCIPLFVA